MSDHVASVLLLGSIRGSRHLEICRSVWPTRVLCGLAIACVITQVAHAQESSPFPPIMADSYHVGGRPLPKMPLSIPTLVFPLFIQDKTHSSVVVLTNSSIKPVMVRLLIRDSAGAMQTPYDFQMKGHSNAEFLLDEVLHKIHSPVTMGSIVIASPTSAFPPNVVGQLTLSSVYPGQGSSQVEEEIEMPSVLDSHLFRSVGEVTDFAPLVSVTSLADQAQHLVIECRWGSRISEKRVALAARGMVAVDPCSAQDAERGQASLARRRSAAAMQISVQSDGPAGSIAAFGVTSHEDDRTHRKFNGALVFMDPLAIRSRSLVYSGILTPAQQSQREAKTFLALANFADKDARVTVDVSSTADDHSVTSEKTIILVKPHDTRQVYVRMAARRHPSVSVMTTSDLPPGRVIAKLFTRQTSEPMQVEQIAKDGEDSRNGGSHPWYLGDGKSSELILFNHSTKRQDVNLVIEGENGAERQRAVQLSPMETRAVLVDSVLSEPADYRPMSVARAAQKSGMVMWNAPGPGVVSGRILVRDLNNKTATSFSCGDVYSLCGEDVQYDNWVMNVGDSQYMTPFGLYCHDAWGGFCDGDSAYEDYADVISWTNSDPSVIDLSPGDPTATLDAESPGKSRIQNWIEDEYGCVVSAWEDIGVKPSITSSPETSDLWYFDGQNPSTYTTSLTLTSSGGSSTTWSVPTGASKVSLSSTTGSSITVTSSNSAYSSSSEDIYIVATLDGMASDAYRITTHKPSKLADGIADDDCSATMGYSETISYSIHDQMDDPIPASVDMNEAWTTGVSNDYTGTNWLTSWPEKSGNTTANPTVDTLVDFITGQQPTANPTPGCVGTGTTKVQHRGQELFVGSQTPGYGQIVQSDTLQKYQDHAAHEGITTNY